MSEWISVKDRLPENGQRVLCYNKYMYVKDYDCVFYDGDFNWTGSRIGQIEGVTHWMPLPKPPKGKP
jgi:hypothetical protein